MASSLNEQGKPRSHSECMGGAEGRIVGLLRLIAANWQRFPAKWVPIRVKKTRQNKEIEPPFRFNRNGKGSSSEEALLLQHHFAVGVFEPLQLRQERQAKQVFRQRFVRQHHGVDVAHHDATDINH